MNFPLSQPILCRELIGRETHLAAMTHTLNREDGAHTLLVSGEAGRGKSRLTTEFKAQAQTQGWRILQSACFEDERAQPYAPITEWLRAAGGPFPIEFAPLLPELDGVGDYDKYRLFFALAQFFADCTVPAPLLLILEDLHWIDEASLELLLALIRRLGAHHVRFLLTFRSDEVHPELAHFLAQLDRERRAVEIRLAPLTRTEVDGMVQAIFRQTRPTRAEFLDTFYPLTEGNPFYIEETLKSLLMAGDITVTEDGIWAEGALRDLPIPRSVQAAVQQRSERLSAPAWDLLTLASVAGRRFDFALIEHLTGHDEMTVLNLIKELLAAQFIVEESADQFAFRHALTREAVYATLLARERRHLHRTIAQTLETLPGDRTQRLSDLAYHFYLGEDWEKTLAYARQAGERAQTVHAYVTAIEHFDRAIKAAQIFAPDEMGSLLYLRGYVHVLIDHFDLAHQDLQAALEEARAHADQNLEWETLQVLGFLWADRDYVRAGEQYQLAQTLARELGDPARIAASLNTIGNWQMNQGHPSAALRNHHEALAISQTLSHPKGIAQALDYLGIASLQCGQIPQGRAYYNQVLPMWDSLNFPRGAFNAYSSLAFVADYDLEMDDQSVVVAVQWGEKSIQLSRQFGWRSAESLALISTGLALRQWGAYVQAQAILQQGMEIAEEVEHPKFVAAAHGGLGAVFLDLLAFSTARQHLETGLTIARETHSAVRIQRTIAYLALAYVRQNEFTLAKTLLDRVLEPDAPMQGILPRMLWGARIELALAMGESASALKWLDRMIAATENLTLSQPFSGTLPVFAPPRIVPRLWHLRAQALTALHRYADAACDLQAALTAATEQERRAQLWTLHRTFAQVQLAQHNLEGAESSLATARTLIEEIATPLRASCPDLAEQFTQSALASLPALPAPSTEPALKQQFGGLTAREREIAALVAQGKTNREIAETLFLSERTAERHIANIMLKLNFNTRAQIAAWVVEKGLDYILPP